MHYSDLKPVGDLLWTIPVLTLIIQCQYRYVVILCRRSTLTVCNICKFKYHIAGNIIK